MLTIQPSISLPPLVLLFPPSPSRCKSSDYYNYHKTDPCLYLDNPIKHLPHSLRWSFFSPRLSRRRCPMRWARTKPIGYQIRYAQLNSPRIRYKTVMTPNPPKIPPIIEFLVSFRIYGASSSSALRLAISVSSSIKSWSRFMYLIT